MYESYHMSHMIWLIIQSKEWQTKFCKISSLISVFYAFRKIKFFENSKKYINTYIHKKWQQNILELLWSLFILCYCWSWWGTCNHQDVFNIKIFLLIMVLGKQLSFNKHFIDDKVFAVELQTKGKYKVVSQISEPLAMECL